MHGHMCALEQHFQCCAQYEDQRGQPAPLGDGFNQPIVIMNVGLLLGARFSPVQTVVALALCLLCSSLMPSNSLQSFPSSHKPYTLPSAVQEPPGTAARPGLCAT